MRNLLFRKQYFCIFVLATPRLIRKEQLHMIETERTLLRPWHESDAESLFKYASNPDVVQ